MCQKTKIKTNAFLKCFRRKRNWTRRIFKVLLVIKIAWETSILDILHPGPSKHRDTKLKTECRKWSDRESRRQKVGSWSSQRWKNSTKRCGRPRQSPTRESEKSRLSGRFSRSTISVRDTSLTCSIGEKPSAEVISICQIESENVSNSSNKTFCSCCFRALRLLPQGEDCRREPDCQVEKAGLRESVLPALHPDARHEFCYKLHLPSAQDKARRGQDCRVCSLWLSRLFRMKL